MNSEILRREKIKADTMRQLAGYPDNEYWLGYRMGLTATKDGNEHDALLGGIGSPDKGRDARGRGYRDGIEFREGLELVGVTEAAEILGWDRRKVAVYKQRGKLPPPVAELSGGTVWRRIDIERIKRENEVE